MAAGATVECRTGTPVKRQAARRQVVWRTDRLSLPVSVWSPAARLRSLSTVGPEKRRLSWTDLSAEPTAVPGRGSECLAPCDG